MQEDTKNKDETAGKSLHSSISTHKKSDNEHTESALAIWKPFPESIWHFKPGFREFEEVEKDPNSTFPYKYIVFGGNYSDLVSRILRPRGFAKAVWKEDDPIDDIDFIWRPINFSPRFYLKIDRANAARESRQHIVINHLENIKGICTKTGLIKSLRRFYKSAAEPLAAHYTVHESVPSTFVILPDCHDAEYQAFVRHFHDLEKRTYKMEKVPAKHCADNLWLIKPAAMNQGRGIEIFRNDLAGMKRFLESKSANSYWVIQKYIERPLLYKGRKFDIRMWAFMSWKGELHYFKHGYIRTSSDSYSLDSKVNYVHLTNNCLQQFGDKYGAFEEGNTIEFPLFKEYLKQTYPNYPLDFETHIIGRIKDLMIDSYLSVKTELNPARRKNCFELLGYDFLIDEDFRVWLIEINTNPYLGLPNKFIEGLMPKMLNDLLELVLDPCVKPVNPLPKRGTYMVDNRVEVENQFELLYDEKRKINQRRSYTDPIYPVPELVPQQNSAVPAPVKQPSTKREGKEAAERSPKKSRPKKPERGNKSAEPSSAPKSEKKEKYKIPSAPPRPKKRLSDEARVLSETDNSEQFTIYARRMAACFGNLDLMPEPDIEDALTSLTIIMNSKNRIRLYLSPLFSVLTKLAVDFKKEIPNKLRRSLMDMIVKVSQDSQARKYLMQVDTIHGLIEVALTSCTEGKHPPAPEQESVSEEQAYAKDAVVVLYNLASFDRPKFYIPGETVRQAKDRRRFILWGGLLGLFYLSSNTKMKEITEFCENTKLKELDLRDHEDLVKALKLYLEAVDDTKSKGSRNEGVVAQSQKHLEEELGEVIAGGIQEDTGPAAKPANLDNSVPQDIAFPEVLKGLKIPELLSTLEEDLQKKKEELNKKFMELHQLQKAQKEEEAKKREEEERIQREKKEKAFQEYIRRVEQRRKEKAEQQKKEQEEKENRLKEEEAKKKSLIEMLKKKEEDRRIKRFQEMKKKAELEKKEAEELEKRNREHMERQQRALEEWHKRKIESAKKIRSSVTDKYFVLYFYNNTNLR